MPNDEIKSPLNASQTHHHHLQSHETGKELLLSVIFWIVRTKEVSKESKFNPK